MCSSLFVVTWGRHWLQESDNCVVRGTNVPTRRPSFLTQLQVQGVPKTTLSFDNWLEGFMEVSGSCLCVVTVYRRERIHIQISQGRTCMGGVQGKVQNWSFSCLLSTEQWTVWHSQDRCVTICAEYCPPGKLTWVSRVSTGAWSHVTFLELEFITGH